MDSQQIRQQFTDFFKDKGHAIVPSAPLVLKGDPTLMFVNSGMAPFKEYFLGNAEPKNSRIADTQKCLRVSGKHNDLEEVGYDTYHHTLFEMLGNWSFGDYFKEEAIKWAWELLNEVYKIDKENLYVTVFEGDKEDGLEMDMEAYDIWKKYISEERILKGNKNDNFWEMGEQGPCGPCSEIHVDIRPESEKSKTPGKDLVNQDHPEVVEIWNLVFMQYNRKANGSLEPLPHKHIDTGMGFERLCMVLQGVRSNYDTDVFKPLINKLEDISNKTYGKNTEVDVAIRVISDHVRAVAFSIADGQLPSNTGAGYVIRRILRRAIRFGFTFLDLKEPFIYELVEVLADKMGAAFPELRTQQRLVEKVIEEEERSFLNTLDQGLAMIKELMDKAEDKSISGKKVFELYDTYGFPVDLTAMILREKGYSFEIKDFESEMKKQKERSRSASETSTGDWVIVKDKEQSEFIGFDLLESEVQLLRYRKVSSKKGGAQYQLVFDKTPFYAEGGGQVGDTGWIEDKEGEKIEILDTKKENNVIYHLANKLPDPHSTFLAIVNNKLRNTTALNHSATHLLHQALREVLGKHVEQKGSAVNPSYLRFDFSHFSKVTNDELRQVEDFVNEKISEAIELEEDRNTSMEEAVANGAIALFGEKYGDKVRTVRFGDSIELCGGTHVSNTANIWYFKITSESAVAAGIRRIEAITGPAVMEYFKKTEERLSKIKEVLNNPQNLISAVENLKDENQALQRTVEELKKEKEKSLKADLKNEFKEINGIQFLAKEVDLDSNGMKNLSFELGNELDNVFILFGSAQNGKALLSCYISKNLTQDKGLNAGQIVRELGKFIQGGGGGQPFYATAGGKNVQGIGEALIQAKSYLE